MNIGTHFGTIIRGRDVAPNFRLSADVVIVGTGAGGSMAFHDLAKAGLRVVAIERGSFLKPSDMTQREEQMIPQLFCESGARATADLGITVLQGQGVGGSTLHNTNLCKRLPYELVREWENDHGLVFDGLTRDFDDVERLLGVRRFRPEEVNRNNRILLDGLTSLGYAGGLLSHNRDERCQKSGFCELGCAYNGKMNALRVLIPPGVLAGGTVLTDARVEAIEIERGAATGVRGRLFDPTRPNALGEFTVTARAVILAGSATGTPALALASNVPDPNGLIGASLHMHPGAAVMGLHREKVEGWKGNPQSVECTEFLQFGSDAEHRVWIVSGFAHPAGASAMIPGFGPEHAKLMRRYAYASVAIAMLHDETRGRVRPWKGDALRIHYRLSDADRKQLVTGLKEAARILLAGGADEVMVPLNPPMIVSSEEQLEAITIERIAHSSPPLTAVHPMSTMPMGTDAERSVCNQHGRIHTLENVFVADGSLFPTSIGGPPQVSIYTFGRRVARAVKTWVS